jgi:FKBP-type peptidyl-prolyl cis-trans isomerase SlyD
MTSDSSTIETGTVVTLNYTLRDDEGQLIHHYSAAAPLVYLHGSDNLVPGLEQELGGRQVGDKLSIVVPPDQGYGEVVGAGPQPVPRSAFANLKTLMPGMPIVAKGPDGDALSLWVIDVGEETVDVDINHPLAGVTLHFDVEITDIRAASEDEKEAGRPI